MPPKRPLARKRQTKLNFSPASNASPRPAKPAYKPSDDSDGEPSPSRPAKRQRSEREQIVISSGSSSDTSDNDGEVQQAPSLRGHKRKATATVLSDNRAQTRPKNKKRRAARRVSPSSDESDGEVTVTGPKDKRTRGTTRETSEGEASVHSKRQKQKRGTARSASPTSSSESEEQVTISTRKVSERKAHSTPVGGKKRKRPADNSSEEEAPRARQRTRRDKQREATPEEDNVEEQEDDSDAEADELKEELAFLQSSPPGLGSTQNRAKSAREKALEAMKRKRAVKSDPPSSSAARRKPVVVDSESDSELEIIPEARDESSSEDDQSEVSDVHDGATAMEVLYGGEDDEDEDFINDEDAPIGVPAEHALPLQFSSLRNAKPRDLFKYAIDWMVQKKINPAFNSKDEIYEMSFKKLDDEISALAGSKYHSSAWTVEFTRAIKARPEIAISDIDSRTRALMEPHCEACNRKSHPASSELSLTGQPYHKETLEPLAANASDSDSDSNSSSVSSTGSEEMLDGEKATYDAQGERIAPESKIFTLGSHCRRNAQVVHTLYHWRYHLYLWVLDYLNREGHCTPEKLVRRDKLSDRKRQKAADKIVAEMEADGNIKKLYRLYRDQIDAAKEGDNSYRNRSNRNGE